MRFLFGGALGGEVMAPPLGTCIAMDCLYSFRGLTSFGRVKDCLYSFRGLTSFGRVSGYKMKGTPRPEGA